MISGVSGYLHRHRKKILISGGLIAGGYFLVDYIKDKFFELQERLATERAARENLKRRFEQNQQDATFTIMALLPTLTQQIVDKFPVEKITNELQAKRTEKLKSSQTSDDMNGSELTFPSSSSVVSVDVDELPKKSKTQLWRDLKIMSLTRALTLIYSSALLVFFSRLQLNILGRKHYILSVLMMAEKNKNEEITMEDHSMEESQRLVFEVEELKINRMYLTFSWWLLNKGWIALSERIENAVIQVFDSVNPRQDLGLEEFSDLVGQVQFRVDHPVDEIGSEFSSMFLNNLLPPSELETYVLTQAPSNDDDDKPQDMEINETLRRLLDETADFIESPNALDVIRKLVHNGLSVFIGKIEPLYVDSQTTKLASILANITRQTHKMTSGSPFDPNEYIQSMINVPELDGFSAMVYSNFDWSNLN